jgi:coenzyme F420-reducing hydrogenase delta subunit
MRATVSMYDRWIGKRFRGRLSESVTKNRMSCSPSKNVTFGAKFLAKGTQRIFVAGASSLSSVFYSVSSLSSPNPRLLLYDLTLVLTIWLLSCG